MWNLKEFSHNIAVIEDNGRQMSYAQLADESDALAQNIPGIYRLIISYYFN